MNHMKIHRVDHIGIIVQDLSAVKAFFLDLGLELLGEMELESELADRVTGLENVRSLIAMLGVPGGGTNIELSQFLRPKDENGVQHLRSNALGIRHICFAVEDIDAIVARLREKGFEPFSDVQNYEEIYKLCYIHGPEGIILELAEKLT